VAVNGACQTVVAVEGRTFDVVAVEETLRKTTLGAFQAGQPVNLERAMLPTSRLDGHLVQGHVDATAAVTAVEVLETSRLFRIRFDARFAPYVIPVGSIALDGVSLTVARLEDPELTVAVIPYTYAHTNISTWQVGAAVNIEFDLIGKYVGRWLERRTGGPAADAPRLDAAWLREQGF
jgi:riboflavin synthase